MRNKVVKPNAVVAPQELGKQKLRKSFRGTQPWKKKVQRLTCAMGDANTRGGQQYLAAYIDGQLQSGPVKSLSPEEIAALADQYSPTKKGENADVS